MNETVRLGECGCEWSTLENGGSIWIQCHQHAVGSPRKPRGARYANWELAAAFVSGLAWGVLIDAVASRLW